MTEEQIRIFKNMSPVRKLEVCAAFGRQARALKAAGLRAQHPEWSEEDVNRKVRELILYARD